MGDVQASCRSLDLLPCHIPPAAGVYIATEAGTLTGASACAVFTGGLLSREKLWVSLICKWQNGTGVQTTHFQESRGSGLHLHQIHLWMGLLTALAYRSQSSASDRPHQCRQQGIWERLPGKACAAAHWISGASCPAQMHILRCQSRGEN